MGNACSDNTSIQNGYDARGVVLQPAVVKYPLQNQGSQYISQVYDDIDKKYPKALDPQITSAYVRDKLTQLGPFMPQKRFDKGILYPPLTINKQGAVYVGQWKNSVPHGLGKLYLPDSSFYSGTFRNGHTFGDGEIQNDLAQGFGVFNNQIIGYKYSGQWQRDVPNGKGVQEWKSGARYEGEIINGRKQGVGKYINPEGCIYEGRFDDNNFDGKGIFKWRDGRVYQGDWKHGRMHGYGIYLWPDGNRYEGHYYEGKKNGLGKFTWANGRYYQGQWQDGQKHGKGLMRQPDGRQILSNWVNGNIKFAELQQ